MKVSRKSWHYRLLSFFLTPYQIAGKSGIEYWTLVPFFGVTFLVILPFMTAYRMKARLKHLSPRIELTD